jgi:hypothetical protein
MKNTYLKHCITMAVCFQFYSSIDKAYAQSPYDSHQSNVVEI